MRTEEKIYNEFGISFCQSKNFIGVLLLNFLALKILTSWMSWILKLMSFSLLHDFHSSASEN